MYKYFLFSFLILASGCSITKTPGFYSGYKLLDSNQQKEITFLDPLNTIEAKPQRNIIQAITGKQLSEFIKKKDTTLIYIWAPFCSSESCLSLAQVSNFCTKNGYELCVIMEYYSGYELSKSQLSPQFNTFTINQQYYGTDYCQRYRRKFTKDLLNGQTIAKSQSYFRYLVFHSDKYIKSLFELK